MTNLIDGFIAKKKAESQFLSLEDGETVQIARLRDIKMVTKAGFGGEEKDVLRLKCEVQTTEGLKDKDFDNGTQKFAKELQDKAIRIGSAFSITRTGTQTKTVYTISEVTNPVEQGVVSPAVVSIGTPGAAAGIPAAVVIQEAPQVG